MPNEQEIQTAFIPKKPLVESDAPRSRSIGLVSFLATVIFVLAIAGAGASYFYKSVLTKQRDELKSSIGRAQDIFDPALLSNIQALDKRLSAANSVLSGHITVYPIFRSLQDSTLKTVRFTRFGYDFAGEGDNASVMIKLSGIASSYNSIALQSDILGKKKFMHDVVFSNLNLDDKGRVTFDLSFSMDPSLISFEKYLSTQGQASAIETVSSEISMTPASVPAPTPSFNLNAPAQ